MTTTDLAQRATVRSLVAAFEATEATIRSSFAALSEAESTLNATFSLSRDDAAYMRIDASRYGFHDDHGNPDQAVERMARKAWRAIVDRLELRRVMSIGRWDELVNQLKDGPLPAITEENVIAFGQANVASLAEMHAEAVGEVYEWLRPRPDSYAARKYKTNQRNARWELGERIILASAVDNKWLRKGMFDVRDGQKLSALERVFQALDGAGMTGRAHYSELETAIKGAVGGRGATALFEFRACANGSLHLRFLRTDLLARFNQVAGGRRLRGEAA